MGQRREKSIRPQFGNVLRNNVTNDLHSVPCKHFFLHHVFKIPLIQAGIGWKVCGKIRQYASNCLADRLPKILNVKANRKAQSDQSVHRTFDLEEMQQAQE